MACNSKDGKMLKGEIDMDVNEEQAGSGEKCDSIQQPQSYLEMRVDELLKTINDTMDARDRLVDFKIEAAQKQMEMKVMAVEKKLESAMKPVNEALETIMNLTAFIKTMLEEIKKNSQNITKLQQESQMLFGEIDEVYEIIEGDEKFMNNA